MSATLIDTVDTVLLDVDGYASHASPSCPAARGPLTEVAKNAGGFYCGTCIDVAPDLRPRIDVAPERTFSPGPHRSTRTSPARIEPTDAQVRYLHRLAGERGRTAEITGRIPALDRKAASALIDELLATPATPAPAKAERAPTPPPTTTVEVAGGRYALDTPDGVRFYRVDRPTDGKWAGFTFVKVQAGDEFHPVRGQAAKVVLAAIAADPQTAMLRYGRELGRCGHCGRTLTDEASRAAGIGPVCAESVGW